MSKKITVVVPVYNVEQYIRKCLDSMVALDYDDFDVLVINDGSPANEQPIIDEYVERYPFIHTIVKENGGYGSALELAVKTVETPFMLVCDPDDYLYPHALKTLSALQERHDSDITIGAKTLVYSDNEEESYDKSFNEAYAKLENGKCYLFGEKAFDDLYFVDPSPHSKLYRVELLKDVIFPHKVSFTDNILYFCSLNKSRKVVYTDEALAYYLINRVGNTMTDVKPSAIDAQTKVLSELIRQNPEARDIFYYRMFEAYKFIMNDRMNHVNGTKEEKREKMEHLYSVIELLLPKEKEIRKYYDAFDKYPILEKIRDHRLLNARTSKKTYQKIMEKKLA